ncbi:hypothetical protein F5Y18DRAFT_242485 [Xylariaceae sp. FL1019]|nr:hypothetical protein F5Y18DRAFT_242485 [Xylariaceae sp. FL1019]
MHQYHGSCYKTKSFSCAQVPTKSLPEKRLGRGVTWVAAVEVGRLAAASGLRAGGNRKPIVGFIQFQPSSSSECNHTHASPGQCLACFSLLRVCDWPSSIETVESRSLQSTQVTTHVLPVDIPYSAIISPSARSCSGTRTPGRHHFRAQTCVRALRRAAIGSMKDKQRKSLTPYSSSSSNLRNTHSPSSSSTTLAVSDDRRMFCGKRQSTRILLEAQPVEQVKPHQTRYRGSSRHHPAKSTHVLVPGGQSVSCTE